MGESINDASQAGAVEGRDAFKAGGVGRYHAEGEGDDRYITSIATPNVRLRVAAGLTFTRKDLRAVDAQTVFLDGAFSGPPFHDGERRIYSLDHHDGCIRSITLSTCEQAAVALVLGMPVNEGLWTVVINEPDLDSILAAWVLMNHVDLVRDDFALLAPVMPLLKVEGNIDSYGFGREVLSGLSAEAFATQREKLDSLMEPVKSAKEAGGWQHAAYESIVLTILDAIDRTVLPLDLVARSFEFQETGRVRLRGRRIAILCRSVHGIYEVEEYLSGRYGKLLGIVVLDQGGGRFTLRRSDGFAIAPLRKLYKALNKVDPLLAGRRRGDNEWGGADDIGGSPRETGTGLTGRQVLEQVDYVYGEPRSILKKLVGLFGGSR